MPPTASADRAATALEELTEALKNPKAAIPFLNTGSKLNEAIEALSEILTNKRNNKMDTKVTIRGNSRSNGASSPRVETAQAGFAPRFAPRFAPSGTSNDQNKTLNKSRGLIKTRANKTLIGANRGAKSVNG